jgi:hypothetical protein
LREDHARAQLVQQDPLYVHGQNAQSTQNQTNRKMIELEEAEEWDQLIIHDSLAHAYPRPTLMDSLRRLDPFSSHGSSKGGPETRLNGEQIRYQDEREDPFLVKQLKELYLKAEYYKPGTKDARFLTLKELSTVRMLINTMLGFILQMESVFGVRRQGGGAGGNGHPSQLPFYAITQFVAAVAYWELFSRAIRLHGWAPVYVATEQVLRMLSAAADTAASRY